jgi:hypothetical protein
VLLRLAVIAWLWGASSRGSPGQRSGAAQATSKHRTQQGPGRGRAGRAARRRRPCPPPRAPGRWCLGTKKTVWVAVVGGRRGVLFAARPTQVQPLAGGRAPLAGGRRPDILDVGLPAFCQPLDRAVVTVGGCCGVKCMRPGAGVRQGTALQTVWLQIRIGSRARKNGVLPLALGALASSLLRAAPLGATWRARLQLRVCSNGPAGVLSVCCRGPTFGAWAYVAVSPAVQLWELNPGQGIESAPWPAMPCAPGPPGPVCAGPGPGSAPGRVNDDCMQAAPAPQRAAGRGLAPATT